MCTAIRLISNDTYVGRNLDYDFSFGEEIVITPRNYIFKFKHANCIKKHYAIIGMAHVENNYPLYYDAMNEQGLAVVGLNFVGNAIYSNSLSNSKINIAQFELIPYILSKCSNVNEAKELLFKTNVMNTSFSEHLPCASLHYMIADKDNCITVEFVKTGMKIYKNKVNVLTNNPPFREQLFNLNNYSKLSNKDPKNTFSTSIDLTNYSRGMGSIGLPGDPSSMSRFVKATFVLHNSIFDKDDISSINQFFHILHSVEQQKGICEVKENEFEYTIYSSCMNLRTGVYYYTTYNSHTIHAVNMNNINLENKDLSRYEMINKEDIKLQN